MEEDTHREREREDGKKRENYEGHGAEERKCERLKEKMSILDYVHVCCCVRYICMRFVYYSSGCDTVLCVIVNVCEGWVILYAIK